METDVKLTEEQINSIAHKINAEIDLIKKEGKVDPLTEEKVKNMITAQVALVQERDEGRKAKDFETKDFVAPEDMEKIFKDVNAMTDDERYGFQETKMLTSKKSLENREASGMGEKIEEFKRLNDDAYLISTMLQGVAVKKGHPIQDYMTIYRNTDIYKEIHNVLQKDVDLRKALAVATSGSGSQWIPTGFSSQVLLSIELQLRVPALFQSIPMPTSPYTLPVQSGNATGYFIPESTADESTKIKASTPGTSNATFTARKLAGRVLFSEEINEDSIVAIRDFTGNELSRAIARAHETSIINGDREGADGSAADHQDNATSTDLFTADQDARLAYDGLRYFALNQTDTSTKDFSNAAPTDALMSNVRVLGGKYSVIPSDNVWISSVTSYLLSMASLTNIVTLDKYGPKATVLSGEIMKYQGIPWVVSEYLYSNLNASGVYDGDDTDRSMLLLVNRPSFYVGTRGGVTLNSEMDIETDQIKLVAKRRVDFVDPYDATATGNPQCVAGINVKTT